MINNTDKKKTQSKEQIFHNFVQIVETFPQYSMVQHLLHILRRKGGADPYTWSDEELLKKFENYYDELTYELANKPLVSEEEEN